MQSDCLADNPLEDDSEFRASFRMASSKCSILAESTEERKRVESLRVGLASRYDKKTCKGSDLHVTLTGKKEMK